MCRFKRRGAELVVNFLLPLLQRFVSLGPDVFCKPKVTDGICFKRTMCCFVFDSVMTPRVRVSYFWAKSDDKNAVVRHILRRKGRMGVRVRKAPPGRHGSDLRLPGCTSCFGLRLCNISKQKLGGIVAIDTIDIHACLLICAICRVASEIPMK